ncbi:cistern family PEP-CTERM protein [Sphingomonas histidinilytica]|uniref:cistern family PEP-CTERM protein n=1 Tax=Rhizorhabdus histidinilytica TaxID=439228 RepID=UPI0009A5B0FF|nr:cistern family PEP-CTERM protein [Rhizorhabdus histidinilytica]MBO9379124.1 cistern family PEP-CTERM protein [Rhizorhabdus histidinilytica]
MLRMIRKAAVAAVAVLSSAMPLSAAVVINSANSGYNFSIDYAGFVNEAWTDQVSAFADFTFDGVSNNGLTYNFSYTMTNNSIVDSRIRSFGVDTSGTVTSLSATGAYQYTDLDGQFPVGVGRLDLCFIATGNGSCTGGPGGLSSNPDESGVGTFAVTFANVMESVTFDNFAVRFQSINPTVNGSSSGVGLGSLAGGGGGNPITAPEPGTWLMLLVGFGLVGHMLRQQQRRPIALPQAA